MRLHLTIKPPPNCAISINYNYYLSSAIYSWIEQSSPEYSAFLHDHGFSPEGMVRRFRHFCFSYLSIPKRTLERGRLTILSDKIYWQISMPVEQSLQHLIVGIFEKKEFYIEREENRFIIEQVEILPEPDWQRTMKFKMLSPLTASIPEEYRGKITPRYLHAGDLRLGGALQKNILNKYSSLYGVLPANEEFQCTLDHEYITRHGGPEHISKLITIRAGHPQETKVKGFICPLTLSGNPELIKLAYDSGLGEKGSMGFGMIEVVK